MTERECFLRAICTNPADDTARLVYADWLDEQDDPSCRGCAMWIRDQMRKGGTRDDMNLWGALAMFACDPSSWGLGMSAGGCKIRRGLIDEISLTLPEFMKIAKKLFAVQPITRVTLSDRVPCHIGDRTYEWWVWSNGRPNEIGFYRYQIQSEFRHFLTGYRHRKSAPKGRRVFRRQGAMQFPYATFVDAHEALSRAAVDYGRWLAGLPRLYTKPQMKGEQ